MILPRWFKEFSRKQRTQPQRTQPDPLKILAHKGMVGIEVDSALRGLPPRCHPETRKKMRHQAKVWLKDPERHSRLLYICGPAGEGKSAIVQSIAEESQKEGHLGASIFFSKQRGHDISHVIPTIVRQLATIHRKFALRVSQVLKADRKIAERSYAIQFKRLIIDPFEDIMEEMPFAAAQPLLIVLDGIDECKDLNAQTGFISLVNDHVRMAPQFPLLWIISSRPQVHLKPLLSRLHCKLEVLKMDDEQSKRDVECVLRDGFRSIQDKYQLDLRWLPKADMQRIVELSSGSFAVASSIIDFLNDSQINNPESQLQMCMKYLDRRGNVSPLQALDSLYHQLISEIPPESHPTPMRVLGMAILYPDHRLPVAAQANFFSLNRRELILSFRGLHTILDIPSAQDAHIHPIHFFHNSFTDFLEDPERSRKFCIQPSQTHFDVALHALRWLAYGGSLNKEDFPWITSTGPAEIQHERQSMLRVLREYSSDIAWIACSNVLKEHASALLDELENLDFRDLTNVPGGIVRFIPWLYSLGSRGQALVHVASVECPAEHSAKSLSAHCALDRQTRRLYPTLFQSAGFVGDPPYEVVFHLGKGGNTCEFALTLS